MAKGLRMTGLPAGTVTLLFTDIVFKEGPSGLQLADLARHRRPDLRVLLTSGYLGDRAVGERGHAGSNGMV